MNATTNQPLPTPNSLDLSPKAYCLLVAIASATRNQKDAIYRGSWEDLVGQSNIGCKSTYLAYRKELIDKGFIESMTEHESLGPSTMRSNFGVKLLKPLHIDRGCNRKKTQNLTFESMEGIEESVLSGFTEDSQNASCECRRAENRAYDKVAREAQN